MSRELDGTSQMSCVDTKFNFEERIRPIRFINVRREQQNEGCRATWYHIVGVGRLLLSDHVLQFARCAQNRVPLRWTTAIFILFILIRIRVSPALVRIHQNPIKKTEKINKGTAKENSKIKINEEQVEKFNGMHARIWLSTRFVACVVTHNRIDCVSSSFCCNKNSFGGRSIGSLTSLAVYACHRRRRRRRRRSFQSTAFFALKFVF